MSEADLLDFLGFFKEADTLDRITIAQVNNFQKNPRKSPQENILNNLMYQGQELTRLKKQLEEMQGDGASEEDETSEEPGKFEIPPNTPVHLNYLSNAPVNFDTIGNGNKNVIEVK